MQYLGDFPEDATVYIPFNTFTSDDPQASATITNLADADIKVHKDGSATQIVTDGATVAIDFDTVTGNHLITIDTSVHADYSIGSDYLVRIEGTTVDGGTINAWVGSFSIENRFNEVNVTKVAGTTQTAGDLAALVTTVDTVVDGIQTDLSNGTDGLGALKALIDTAQSDLDIITGADGVTIATSQGNITFGTLDTGEITITSTGAGNNITLAGSGSGDGIEFTRSGVGGEFGTNWAAAIESEVNDALVAYDPATGTEIAAIDTKIDTIDTNVDAVLVDTGTTLPATLTTIEGKVDTVDTNVDAVLVDTGTTIPASISGLNDLSAAQVNAEMLDVLQTDTFAELASVPAATSSLKDKITFLFMLARNQVEQTATTKTLRADNTSTAVGTATVSDDGTTYTDGEFS